VKTATSRFRLPSSVALVVLLAGCSEAQPPPAASAAATDDVAEIRKFLTHVEQVFDAGDLDAAVAVFTDDAMISSQGAPDTIGKDAIRAAYAGALAATNLHVRFHTDDIEPRGDLAYEQGTYDLTITDKGTGQQLATMTNRHIHILKKQPDGEWKTWRMFTNSAEAPAAPPPAQ
jgi:uncharacterized protein (TIGR02246 family)